jgi:hypothetical protein
MEDKIVQQVVNRYQSRSDVGVRKYGTTLEGNNKDNYLRHIQEEMMDATLYIEKLITQKEEITNLVKSIPNDMELGAAIRKLVS